MNHRELIRMEELAVRLALPIRHHVNILHFKHGKKGGEENFTL